jgi:hypothetical protein
MESDKTPRSKAGALAYIAKEYDAVHALADPDDEEANAYLAHLKAILDAADAGITGD